MHPTQHAHPALRQLWDGGGRFKQSCHGSTKSSTHAQRNNLSLFCFKTPTPCSKWNFHRHPKSMIYYTRLLVPKSGSFNGSVYFTYQANQHICFMLTLIRHCHQNCTALDPKQFKQTQRRPRQNYTTTSFQNSHWGGNQVFLIAI